MLLHPVSKRPVSQEKNSNKIITPQTTTRSCLKIQLLVILWQSRVAQPPSAVIGSLKWPRPIEDIVKVAFRSAKGAEGVRPVIKTPRRLTGSQRRSAGAEPQGGFAPTV
jgi:hypothetical protein